MNCEIEFLPVGDASKAGDAIVLRYGEASAYDLMVVDGGNLDSGRALVTHIQSQFGANAVISHVLLTHADADHASGLRELLSSDLKVLNVWLHVPWEFAGLARPYFANKNWTDGGLRGAIEKEYDLIAELKRLAIDKKIPLRAPFAGGTIGPFRVLSPHQDVYPLLLPQFDRTPDADQAAIEAAGWWIGKQPNFVARLLEKALRRRKHG